MPSSQDVPRSPPNSRSSDESSQRSRDSFGSDYSCKDKDTPRSSRLDDYQKSLGSHPSPSRKPSSHTSKPSSSTVNVYTHCGRHTDQYLFGGWSNVVRSAFKKE
ncbi:hypothetical protein GGR54DRAFT_637130 [Hypoxylon sp. NC1633]|nr:hypothetical protein GGR54DRAFT_637130 [Hypoxylon sp. NC1633]